MTKPDANGWHDISSAPKDGTRIWLYWPENAQDDHQAVGWFEKQIDGEWFIDNADSDWNGQPTHWRLLPEPPVLP